VSYVAYSGRTTPTKELFDRITTEIGKIYVGQEELVLGTLVALFSSGHVLIESVPGLGKTLFVRTMGRVLGCDFGRIQFTADLLPTDIIGVSVIDVNAGSLTFRPGPVFHQVVLADEINRATPRTQSALLEAMAECQVSVEGRTHPLPAPFFVIATQNPVEHYGTFPLPESQMDRFMMALRMGYPGRDAERSLLADLDTRARLERAGAVIEPSELVRLQDQAGGVLAAPAIIEYVLDLARASRRSERLLVGVSPRGAEHWVRAAKAFALLGGRDYCLPEDVQAVAGAVIGHRILPRGDFEKVDRASLVRDLLSGTPVI
jgi:MoxR-like ATPase